jgi:hypothetical protein
MQDFAAVIDTDVDDRPAASTFDTVDSAQSAWTTTGTVAADVWAREQDATGAWLWRGVALPSASDTRLESPDIVVAPAGNFVFTFAHRHDFEADASPAKYWDGGVLELSVDGGQSWADVSTLVAPGYGGALATNSQNPLGGRQAFVGKSANYPQMVPVTLAFGEALAGKTVRFRFRLGTDLAVGAAGWELDDFGVVFAELAPATFFADFFTSGFAIAFEAAFAAFFAGFAVGLFAASFVTFTAGLVAACLTALVRAFVMVAPRSLTPGSHAPRAQAPRP